MGRDHRRNGTQQFGKNEELRFFATRKEILPKTANFRQEPYKMCENRKKTIRDAKEKFNPNEQNSTPLNGFSTGLNPDFYGIFPSFLSASTPLDTIKRQISSEYGAQWPFFPSRVEFTALSTSGPKSSPSVIPARSSFLHTEADVSVVPFLRA